MHAESFNDIFSKRFTTDFREQMLPASYQMAEQNAERIGDELPQNVILPTGEDIRRFKLWEMNFRTKHPGASEREVKRAVMRQFNIVVVKGQNMVQKSLNANTAY